MCILNSFYINIYFGLFSGWSWTRTSVVNISYCEKIKEIIKQIGQEVKRIYTVFNETKLWELNYLARFTIFCWENHPLEWNEFM